MARSTRREFLGLGASLALGSPRRARLRWVLSDDFPHGVASGDPGEQPRAVQTLARNV